MGKLRGRLQLLISLIKFGWSYEWFNEVEGVRMVKFGLGWVCLDCV